VAGGRYYENPAEGKKGMVPWGNETCTCSEEQDTGCGRERDNCFGGGQSKSLGTDFYERASENSSISRRSYRKRIVLIPWGNCKGNRGIRLYGKRESFLPRFPAILLKVGLGRRTFFRGGKERGSNYLKEKKHGGIGGLKTLERVFYGTGKGPIEKHLKRVI